MQPSHRDLAFVKCAIVVLVTVGTENIHCVYVVRFLIAVVHYKGIPI